MIFSLLMVVTFYLQVFRLDHGTWMCLVNDNKEFNTIKEFISVKVGDIAETGVTIEGVEEYDNGVLQLVEGDSIDVLCYARYGYPSAYLTWTGPENKNSTEDLVISQVRIHSVPCYPF